MRRGFSRASSHEYPPMVARYLSTVVENVLFRDMNLFQQSKLLAGYNKFAVNALNNFVMAPPGQVWQDYAPIIPR